MAAYITEGGKAAETTAASARSMGAESAVVEAEGMTSGTAGMGVYTGVKGIYPTPPIPKTISSSSAVISSTITEFGCTDKQEQGGRRV